MTDNLERTGVIAETLKDNLRILWTYVPGMPPEDVRLAAPWLTVVRWLYDGAANEGMPTADDNQHMLQLESILRDMEDQEVCIEAYRRIGAGLREFVFYIADRDEFLQVFNSQVATHPQYPIEIKFYKDETWSELKDLIDDLKSA
jgi:hypothetical protein